MPVVRGPPAGGKGIGQVEPKVALLDHQGGHHLTDGMSAFFGRPEVEVSCRTELPEELWVSTTLVHVHERLGLVDLQERHGMQGGSSLSTGFVSQRRETGRKRTSLGREVWIPPPGGSGRWTQLHCNGTLHRRVIHIPLGRSSVKGGEEGGANRPQSGTIRCRPRLGEILMHL
ncbi:hypothetical protein PO909_023452 [Leuciscus waleckii]